MVRVRGGAGRLAALVCDGVLLLAGLGCHSKSAATPENFLVGLNAYLMEHPECLFPQAPRFPYETSDPVETKEMNALVKEQMLTVEEERSIHVSRYTPTDAGARVAPRFCYGHRVATGIASFTPPRERQGTQGPTAQSDEVEASVTARRGQTSRAQSRSQTEAIPIPSEGLEGGGSREKQRKGAAGHARL